MLNINSLQTFSKLVTSKNSLNKADKGLNNPSFTARIRFGDPGNENPLACLFNNVGKYKPSKLPVTDAQLADLHAGIVNLIREQMPKRGVVDPTMNPQSKVDCALMNQCIETPSSLDDRLRNYDLKAREAEQGAWKSAGQEMGRKFQDTITQLNKQVMKTDPKSPEFVRDIIDVNAFLATGIEIEMNKECGCLEKLAECDEATIFIFNHPSPPYDLSVSFGFIAELYKAYEDAGKAESCPRPKYILTDRVNKALPKDFSEVFQKIEAVGIDAATYPTADRAKTNGEILKPVIDGFIKDENHIFIFPEGGRPRYKDIMPLEERFQYGIAKIIKKAAKVKSRVKVVPVGLDYKDGVGTAHIGTPVYYKATDNIMKVSKGVLKPETEVSYLSEFYRTLAKLPEPETMMAICHSGEPVQAKCKGSDIFQSRLVAGTLCTNMGICVDTASRTLKSILDIKA